MLQLRALAFFTFCEVLLVMALRAQSPAELYQQAVKEQNAATKVELLTQAIRQAPSNQAYYQRGFAYAQLGRYDAAEADFNKGLTVTGELNAVSMYGGLVYCAYNTGRYTQTITLADKALSLSPTYPYVLRYRALAQQALGNLPQALQDANRAIEQAPQHAFGFYVRAGILKDQQEYTRALADVNQALALQSNDSYYLQRKLLLLDKLNRRAEVESLAPSVIQFSQNDPLSLSNLGVVFQNNNDIEAAVRYHTSAIALFNTRVQKETEYKKNNLPMLYNIYINRGDAYYASLGRAGLKELNAKQANNRALDDYVFATELMPDNYLAWNRIGQLQTLAANYDEAIRAYEKSFTLNPQCPDGWVNLGFSYSEKGQRTQAINTYTRALGVPNVTNRGLMLNNRGFCYLELKEMAKALADLQAAITQDPTVPMSHISLGEYYMAAQQPDQALQKFNEALAMPRLSNRELWTARYRRGLVHQGKGNHAAARTDFEAATRADAAYADAYEQLALSYYNVGDYCNAYKVFQQAQQKTERMDRDAAQQPAVQVSLYINKIQVLTHSNPCK